MNLEWGSLPISFWRETDFWPHEALVVICAGGGGHEREITVSFHDDDGGPLYDWDNGQPDFLVGLFTSLLPEGWTVDDRGTRLELHPSGNRYQGWDKFDVAAVERAALELGFSTNTVVYE